MSRIEDTGEVGGSIAEIISMGSRNGCGQSLRHPYFWAVPGGEVGLDIDEAHDAIAIDDEHRGSAEAGTAPSAFTLVRGKTHYQAVLALARRRVNALHAILRIRDPYSSDRSQPEA